MLEDQTDSPGLQWLRITSLRVQHIKPEQPSHFFLLNYALINSKLRHRPVRARDGVGNLKR